MILPPPHSTPTATLYPSPTLCRSTLPGPLPFWPLDAFIKHAIGVPMTAAVNASNHEAFLSAVVPAGNIYASADDASRVFQMLLNGGELDGVRVLKPETVADAIKPVGKMQLDRTQIGRAHV